MTVAPAIGNAIYDATGVRLNSLPLSRMDCVGSEIPRKETPTIRPFCLSK